ncbi:MAG: hypothetical protein KY476_02160 [Planctomycetes bacterium]|nr:hypothetical protein [Planctomycetota bacterium]
MATALAEPVTISVRRDFWSIRRAVERLLADETAIPGALGGSGHSAGGERRNCDRVPLDRAGFFEPIELEGSCAHRSADGPQRLVLSRDISPAGVGLTHDEPLPSRHGVVWFSLRGGGAVRLVVERCWSQLPNDRYEWMSGFKIVGVADTP